MLPGLSQKVQPDRHVIDFQADKQLFGQLNMLRIGRCILAPGYGLDKRGRDRRRKLPPG
jgi:hypothetical protein